MNGREQVRKGLSIGRLARRAGVSVDSVRFYERSGLLPEPARTESNYRIYPEATAARIRFVKRAQRLGFSLGEIRDLLDLGDDPTASKAEVKAATEAKIADIRARIRDLQRMLSALETLNHQCDGHGPVGECPILHALAGELDGPETVQEKGSEP